MPPPVRIALNDRHVRKLRTIRRFVPDTFYIRVVIVRVYRIYGNGVVFDVFRATKTLGPLRVTTSVNDVYTSRPYVSGPQLVYLKTR